MSDKSQYADNATVQQANCHSGKGHFCTSLSEQHKVDQMAKVVIQLISDIGEVESESTVIADTTINEAERVMAAAVDAATELRPGSRVGFVTEFHYGDGDVGAYDDLDVRKLWAYFTKSHEPSHIIIRPDTDQGQELSNRLLKSRP